MGFNAFSRADVELLKAAPSEPVKVRLIDKLHESFYKSKLSDDEKLIAEEILRFLAADISSKIRQSIATRFCDDINLPYDVAVSLANDLEDLVALPIIENSHILKEKDLVEIIESGNQQRQKAVARRADLSENMADKLITKTDSDVVAALLNNKKAKLTPNNTEAIINHFNTNQSLMRSMIASKRVTSAQAHELLTMVSSDLRKMLIINYEIPSNVVNNLVHDSKESLILNMILSNMQRRNTETLVQMISKLYVENELTFSVLIKALSFGNLDFFEYGLTKLCNINIDETRRILWNGHDISGFAGLYKKAALPETMIQAVYKLMQITHEETSNHSPDSAAIYYRILNRLARASNNEKITNLDYLVTIVAHNLKKSNFL